MKTHLVLHVSSEGMPASKIVDRLTRLGFDTTLGRVDFVYNWKDKDPTLEEVITFVDNVIEEMLKSEPIGKSGTVVYDTSSTLNWFYF